MKFYSTNWKGDYIYLLPSISICIDKDKYTKEKSIYIKLSFLKYNLELIIVWNGKK